MSDFIGPDGLLQKFWLKSKTVLFAIGTAIAGLGDIAKPYTDDLREALGKHWFAAVMVGIGAVTFYLRSKTAGGITIKRPEQ